MPPSRHSSSSHSSRSSSSRSSSSRTSGSSSRGPSSHSSSSYSSRRSSSPSRSPLFGSSRGPGTHSSTSLHSNAGAVQARQNGADWRPRVNQPTGFVAATRMRPTYYYGKRHSYAYYPEAWTDAETGVSFEKGYYDENGRRYDDVTFEENGRYKNVVCHIADRIRSWISALEMSQPIL